MLNKKTLIVATSLGAIPLTAALIAIVTRRAKHGSLQRSTLSGRTRSESSNTTTTTVTAPTTTRSQQQKEESQSESVDQRSETAEVTTTSATSISTNVTDSDKDIPTPIALAVTVSSPMEPSSSTGSATIASTTSQTPKEEEISISDEAKKAAETLKELIIAAIKDAKNSAKGTGNRLKEETVDIAATTHSKDIQSIGDALNTLVGLFEKMMTEIRKEDYNAQIKLLQSYKDLLQAQIKVANSRGMMARKLKPGA